MNNRLNGGLIGLVQKLIWANDKQTPASAPSRQANNGERGMALVAVMLIMSLLVMLALAVTFTSVSDKAITSNFKNLTSGFYAAEAGVNNLHRLLRNDKFILGSLPETPRITPGEPTLSPATFIVVAEAAMNKTETFPNQSAYRTKIKIKDFQMPYSAHDSNPAHAGQRVKFISPSAPQLGQVEPYTITYQLESAGQGINGLNGAVTLVEEGVMSFKLLVKGDGGGLRVGTFAEVALFYDTFDPYNPEGPFIYQGLGPGDRFAGRVHTNQRFGFWTPADGSDAPVFHGHVSQSYRSASYYRHAGGYPPAPVDADSDVVDGVLVAPKFLAGFERGVDPIPPKGNAFDQSRAVLDGGYALSAGPPTDSELHQALRAAGDLSTPLAESKTPDATDPSLAPGVYLPSDGETLTGSGLYVMGNVDEMTLSADPSGNREIIKIKQNGKTTTVVIDIDANTTTVDAGNGVRTLRGTPQDRSIAQHGTRSAASLYVRGDISSLHGPGRDRDNQPIPAIDSDFSVTVTAGGVLSGNNGKPVTGGNIVLTGDLTYETPIVDKAGNPINQDAKNVLGLFASGGNVEIPTNGKAPDNMTVNASIAAFALTNDDGSPVMDNQGRAYGGRVRAQDLIQFQGMPFRGYFNLVGGIQATNFDNMGVYNGQMHGYNYKGTWDPRYDNNQAPPFYPGYVVNTGGPSGPPTVSAQANNPVVLSYTRKYYGAAQTSDFQFR